MSGERGKSKSQGGSPCPLPLLITSSRETQRDKKAQTAGERESPAGQEGQRGTWARQGTGATEGRENRALCKNPGSVNSLEASPVRCMEIQMTYNTDSKVRMLQWEELGWGP